jgi:queuine tRNA-ribosyltransferase
VCGILPKEKPRYLMGVGTPENILQSIALGVDMFDCVLPSRNARHGLLYTTQGVMNMKNAKWKTDFSVLDENGTSFVDTAYTKAYLRHLFAADESLAAQIATLHNLAFFLHLVTLARQHIVNQTYSAWYPKMIEKLTQRL